jgi:hypothetical protein
MFDFITPPDPPKPVIILDDRGGRVSDYMKAAQEYATEGREVRIIGLCWSACSLALSVPNVCVGSMATVMFHDAYDLKSGKVNLSVTMDLLNQLPKNIRDKVSKTIQKDFRADSSLDASALIKLGVRKCERELD